MTPSGYPVVCMQDGLYLILPRNEMKKLSSEDKHHWNLCNIAKVDLGSDPESRPFKVLPSGTIYCWHEKNIHILTPTDKIDVYTTKTIKEKAKIRCVDSLEGERMVILFTSGEIVIN